MRYLYFLMGIVTTSYLTAQNVNFKLMTYNLMYYKDASAPCTPTLPSNAKDLAFKKVFQAVNPDILCVNELVGFSDNSGARSVLNNVINTDGEQNFTSAGYSNNTFSSITNMLFYDSTMFVLHSQDYISSTVNNISLPRVIDFYRLYYKDPLLGISHDTIFFTVISAHLKAGSTTSDENDRKLAAEAVMDYLTTTVSDQNVILTGDMNIYGNTEAAYQAFVNYSTPSESFIDPLPAGSWNNNSNYAQLHTQSTHAFGSGCYVGGGLDDRFDFVMFSQAINSNGDYLKYKLNSCKAIGNDGAHFNQSVNAGTNTVVSSTVADALYDFSDHLPVVAEFELDLITLSNTEVNPISSNIQFNNPIGESIKLRQFEQEERMEIALLDITGRIISECKWPGHQSILEISTSDLKPGIYIMVIRNESGAWKTIKLIKSGDEIR